MDLEAARDERIGPSWWSLVGFQRGMHTRWQLLTTTRAARRRLSTWARAPASPPAAY
jgi:hypothetical protein